MVTIKKINDAAPGKEQAAELVRQCRIELRACSGNWARLARMSNGTIGYAWLQQFAKGNIITPKIDTILELAKYLGIKIEAKAGPHYNKFPG